MVVIPGVPTNLVTQDELAAATSELVTDAELTAALSPYLTSANAASTYAALTGATFTGQVIAQSLETRNGTSPTSVTINNTWTSDTNRETGYTRWAGNAFCIGTEKGSLGGVARSVNIQTDGTTRWACNAAGDVTQSTMNYTFSGEGRVNAGGRLLMRGNGGAEDCVVVSSLSNQTGANVSLLRLNGMLAATSAGTQQGILLSNTYVQSGASGSTDLRITRTETTIGSGEHLFINFALGSTRQFVVQRDGKPVFRANGAITIAQNEMMSFEATSNTAGNIVYRGSDGVTRRMALTFS